MTHPAAVFILLAVSLGLAVERMVTLLPRDLRVTLPDAGTASLRVVGLSASTPEEVLDSVDVAIRVLP